MCDIGFSAVYFMKIPGRRTYTLASLNNRDSALQGILAKKTCLFVYLLCRFSKVKKLKVINIDRKTGLSVRSINQTTVDREGHNCLRKTKENHRSAFFWLEYI